MPSVKQSESVTTNKSLEMDIERNVHEMKRSGAAFRQTENGDDDMTANNLAALLRRVSEAATREIDTLIGELHGLLEKLDTNCEQLQNGIAEYAKLGQAVTQVTAIVSENVKSLPTAKGNGRVL